ELLSYDANGKRRFPNGADDTGNTVSGGVNDLGFTGHEQLEEIGMIHMNGRLYDPRIGRFVSADPTTPTGQTGNYWNRYSYVLNNPLGYVDPSGYSPARDTDTDWVDGPRGPADDVVPMERIPVDGRRPPVGNGLGALTSGNSGSA